jgi:hypothetical protein
MKFRLNIAAVASVGLAASLLGGCASAARPEAISTTLMTPAHKSTDDVSVAVSGGNAADISNDAFAQALRDSIERSGIFAKVGPSGGARYQLQAVIARIDHPSPGVSFILKVDVSYTLIDTQTIKTLWSRTISGEHAAHFSDAAIASTRLRRAEEGAAKDNVEQALTQIAALNLP